MERSRIRCRCSGCVGSVHRRRGGQCEGERQGWPGMTSIFHIRLLTYFLNSSLDSGGTTLVPPGFPFRSTVFPAGCEQFSAPDGRPKQMTLRRVALLRGEISLSEGVSLAVFAAN